jgi:hypothetical protein
MSLGVSFTGLTVITEERQNRMPEEEYLRNFRHLDFRLHRHFHGEVPYHGPND